MKPRLMICIALALAPALAFCSVAKAQTTLQQLLDGDAVTAGGAVFFNFNLTGNDGTIMPDLSLVTVEGSSASGAVGLQFFGNGEFALDPGFDSIILGIEYDAVFGTSQNFITADLSAGNANLGTEGYANLNTWAFSSGLLGEADAEIDPLFGINNPVDTQLLSSSATNFSIQTNFSLFADSATGVTLDSFNTISSPVPEPSTFGLLAIAASTVIMRRRRS